MSATALYAYVVLPHPAAVPAADPVLPGGPLGLVEAGGLAALVSAVPRAAFDRAMADRFGPSAPDEVKANVTIASRRNSWLGPHIQWVRFKNLTRSWWNTNVRGVL